MVHIGSGFLLLQKDNDEIYHALKLAVHTDFKAHDQPHGKSDAAKIKRLPFELLSSALWPHNTHLKFYSIRPGNGCGRSQFHTMRLVVAVRYLTKQWKRIHEELKCDNSCDVKSGFGDKYAVKDFFLNHVSKFLIVSK